MKRDTSHLRRALTRREAVRAIAAGGLVGLGAVAGCGGGRRATMMDGMMGSATAADMNDYMDLFARHIEIHRTVEVIPGGVRTVTESEAPELVAQLQAHVANMYAHLEHGSEVRCVSATLPTLFRNAEGYRRRLRTTSKGVVVIETSPDRRLARIIREHAAEVSGFVRDGMQAMMQG